MYGRRKAREGMTGRTARIHQAACGLALAAAAWLAPPALAGSITAELNRTEGAIGESFVLTLSVAGDRERDPEPPQVDGLVIAQRGVSESTVFSDGHRVSELQVTYAIDAQQAGDFTIPSFRLTIDGKDAASLPLTLHVHPAGQGGAAARGRPAPGGTGSASPQAKLADTGGVFIERECDKTAPYVGEQVICAVRVFHRGNLNGGQRVSVSSPEFRRFNVEGEKRYQRLVNGQRYAVIELTEIVVPTKAGALELPPYTIDARVLTWSRRANPLDKFFDNFRGGVFNFDLSFTEEKQVSLKSAPTPLAVKPLPDTGKPPGFSGLVGAFALTTEVGRRQLPAGETVTITIKVSGDNISDTLAEPALSLAPIGKTYADKPEYVEQTSAETGIHSTRTFKIALVPTKPGGFDLGSVVIPVFNPKLDAYVSLSADLGRLIVEPSKAEEQALVVGQGPAAPGGAAKADVKTLAADLMGLHRDVDLSNQQTITTADVWVLSFVGGMPLSLAFFAIGYVQWRDRQARDGARGRRSHAFQRFQTAVRAAGRELDAAHLEPGLSQAYRAFKDYLGDKLALPGNALTARDIDAALAQLHADAALRRQAAVLIAKLESVAFSGEVPEPASARQLYAALVTLTTTLESV